jgi:GNAT superfamily N-acetyltransferase
MTYAIDAHADPDAVHAAVRQGIRSADPPDVPPRDWQIVSLALRDADGAIVGGLHGATMWSWLMIDGRWVAEALRGQGLGRRLLLAAEELAPQFRHAWLTYERLSGCCRVPCDVRQKQRLDLRLGRALLPLLLNQLEVIDERDCLSCGLLSGHRSPRDIRPQANCDCQ